MILKEVMAIRDCKGNELLPSYVHHNFIFEQIENNIFVLFVH